MSNIFVVGNLEMILNCDITYQDVFCGFHVGNTLFANYLCSICSFVIYKEWLVCSLKQQSQQAVCNLSYLKNDLCSRLEIYSKAGIRYTDLKRYLESVVTLKLLKVLH